MVPATGANVPAYAAGLQYPQSTESGLSTSWRYTRNGWEDSSQWTRPPVVRVDYGIHHVNPVLIGLQILLLSAGAAIWASDEWEVAQALGDGA